ncbi:MAG: hypothetical protein JWR28_2609, partial [Modestobacter sp.]|nr:hypothetical protein [Modestobacter sp.]
SGAASPDEDFRAATRARLVAMAAVREPVTTRAAARRPDTAGSTLRRLLASGAEAPAARWRSRVTAGLAGAALTVTALGGLLAASQGARPGDLLYDVKLGGEHTQLALASDSTRGRTLLDFARTRLDELTTLTRAGASALPASGAASPGTDPVLAAGPDVAVVADTLGTMDRQTTEGTWWLTTQAAPAADRAALSALSDWAQEQSTGLTGLAAAIPAAARPAFTTATDLVTAVAARAAALQEAVSCAGGPSTGGTDELGPLPAACPAPAPTPGSATPTSDGGRTTAGSRTPGATPTTGTVPSDQAGLPSIAVPPPPRTESGAPAPTTGRSGAPVPTTGRSGAPVPPTGPSIPALPSVGVPGPGGGSSLPPLLPPGTPATPSPPLIQLPLPVAPSGSPICVGQLICIGP